MQKSRKLSLGTQLSLSGKELRLHGVRLWPPKVECPTRICPVWTNTVQCISIRLLVMLTLIPCANKKSPAAWGVLPIHVCLEGGSHVLDPQHSCCVPGCSSRRHHGSLCWWPPGQPDRQDCHCPQLLQALKSSHGEEEAPSFMLHLLDDSLISMSLSPSVSQVSWYGFYLQLSLLQAQMCSRSWAMESHNSSRAGLNLPPSVWWIRLWYKNPPSAPRAVPHKISLAPAHR